MRFKPDTFAFASGEDWVNVTAVRCWKAIVSVLLLAVWAACTVRCGIENFSQGTKISCCAEDSGQPKGSPDNSEQCVCSSLLSAGYVWQEVGWVVPLPLQTACLFDLSPSGNELLVARPLNSVVWALKPWQFTSRAALPVRAPSLAS
jgi:hypothetical protein